MCDQDHFENDRQEYEARGLVTRKQFGKILGAGIAMMLPQVANAVTVTESDVTVTTPDGWSRRLSLPSWPAPSALRPRPGSGSPSSAIVCGMNP